MNQKNNGLMGCLQSTECQQERKSGRGNGVGGDPGCICQADEWPGVFSEKARSGQMFESGEGLRPAGPRGCVWPGGTDRSASVAGADWGWTCACHHLLPGRPVPETAPLSASGSVKGRHVPDVVE